MSKAGKLYAALLEASKNVSRVAASCEGKSNKDIRQFTEELEALCEKWEQKVL